MSEAPLQLTCRSCGIGHLVLSASGILCLDCNAKIIPTGEINDHFDGIAPSMVASLPIHECTNVTVIANAINRFRKITDPSSSPQQRAQAATAQDKATKRMTLQRLKIENEALRQNRILFEGDQLQDIQLQRTLF